MKHVVNGILVSSLFLSFSLACNQAKFGGSSKKDKVNNGDVVPVTLVLDVTTPSDSIQTGNKTMQATATLRGKTEIPDVEWSLESAVADKGSIDVKGLYTSPATAEAQFPVTLVATLKKDRKVQGKKTIQVNPLFVTCEESSQSFPILAKIYAMPSTVKRLPDYNNLAEATYRGKVCMENYAVEPRNFEEGFPKVKDLVEYFSLQTTTTLVVPADGEYTFQLNSDDGSRLYIDGREVINNDGEHQAYGPAPEESREVGLKEVVIHLKKGDHPLVLNYFQGPRYRIGLMLKWKTPGAADYVYVPRESFK